MDAGQITAYPRHHSFAGYSPRRRVAPQAPGQWAGNGLGRIQYSSDPTLLDDKEDGAESWVSQETAQSGRRSAMSMNEFSRSEESENVAREARKAKKKKLRHLKSFVHVFLGGLRRKPHAENSEEEEEASVASTRRKERDERERLARAVAEGSRSPREAEGERHERARRGNGQHGPTSPRHGSGPPRLPHSLGMPGLHGIYNHGNTCFMNAVVQCLSNTDQLAAFFVTDTYKGDLNKSNRGTQLGTAGDVTQQFALLLKCLWSGQYNPVVSSRFKETVGRYAEQYQGTAQHDAQEFFLWLLDNIHEDLNQAGKRKYRPLKDTVGRPDEEVAAEALASHMQLNNSFIQSLFQGQFRSALLCPSCSTRSCTFDPYICISLPLPQRETKPVYVTVVYRGSRAGCRVKVFGVNCSIDGSIRELRNKLAELCGVHRHHLVLCDLLQDGFHRTFYDDQHISVIHSNDLVFAFECPPYRGDNPDANSHANPSGSKELVLVLVVNKFGKAQHGRWFGQPLILRVWRDLTHFQFQSVVLKHMVKYLREGLKLPEVCRRGILFHCRTIDGLPGRNILPTEADHPFYSPSVDKALNVSMVYGGPAHIKVVCEWDPEIKSSVFGVIPELKPEAHESVLELRQYYCEPLQTTLEECLQIYTREETLNREDSWYCPHCRHQQQDATKKITLWTLPDVLVIHLKRFRQVGYSRTKLGTHVKFPITGLDMAPFLAPRSAISSRSSSATPSSHQRSARAPSKSVHFEDEVGERGRPQLGRGGSMGRDKGKKFVLPWRRQMSEPHRKGKREGEREGRGGGGRGANKGDGQGGREGGSCNGDVRGGSLRRERSAAPRVPNLENTRSQNKQRRRNRSPDPPHRPYSPSRSCDSPTSLRSAPSTMERMAEPPSTPNHRHFCPPSPLRDLANSRTSLDEMRLDNMYDLIAVCNHSGTLSRGHYTAFCKNPVDGRWYNYDDIIVQSVNEEHLITPAAYMLFYVRQSLLSPSPLSSSESSQSSGGSYHWLHHMPPFKLDLSNYKEELAQLQRQQSPSDSLGDPTAEARSSRSRINSTNSARSAPSNCSTSMAASRMSPQSSTPDIDSVMSPGSGSMALGHASLPTPDGTSDARSATSLPSYKLPGRQFNNGTQRTLPNPPSYNHTIIHSSRGPGPVFRYESMRAGKVGERHTAENDGALRRGYSFQSRYQDTCSSHSNTTFQAYDGLRPRHIQSAVTPTRSIPSLPTQEELAPASNRNYYQQHFVSPALSRQKGSASNGHIAISIGTRFTPPKLAGKQPESCV